MKILESVTADVVKEDGVKEMKDMQPLEVCVIVEDGFNKNHIVMRTADKANFEAIDLTEIGFYWIELSSIKVKPYTGNSITLNLREE